VCASPKTFQKDAISFRVYLILFLTPFLWKRGFGHFTLIFSTLPAPGGLPVAGDGAYLLGLVPLLRLRQVLRLGRQMLRLLVVVGLLALLAVATDTLLAILRRDLLEEPSKAKT